MNLTKDDIASLVHALHQLEANMIDHPNSMTGWYTGNEAYFINQHIKAKALLRRLVEEKGGVSELKIYALLDKDNQPWVSTLSKEYCEKQLDGVEEDIPDQAPFRVVEFIENTRKVTPDRKDIADKLNELLEGK